MKATTTINKTLALVERNGIYYARVNLGSGQYSWKSLRLPASIKANKKKAEQAALLYAGEVANMKKNGHPVTQRTFGDVIAEYVKARTAENSAGFTKISTLRQILRVSKFLDEYAGSKPITTIGDAELEDYVTWRTNYYNTRKMPTNAKAKPKDKTLKWETTFMKSILIWTQRRGYYGNKNLPTWSFKVKNKGVRPAFTWAEYNKLWRALIKWLEECGDNPERSYTRALLRDYVLVLANSGMRIGEANELRVGDIAATTDKKGRKIYELNVKAGKTGNRPVTLRAHATKYIDRLLERNPDKKPTDYLFSMKDGTKIKTLSEQFDKVLDIAGIKTNAHGEKFSLYSLRHYYAVGAIRRDISHFTIASNMGTSVQMIENYYGTSAKGSALLTSLAD
jgi:integrase